MQPQVSGQSHQELRWKLDRNFKSMTVEQMDGQTDKSPSRSLIGTRNPQIRDENMTKFGKIKNYVIRTLHDCLSQMNENLLISNSKLTSDSELIW